MYRFLTLDGGGARGVFQIAFLNLVEQTFSIRLSKAVHLLAGTSVGSILAMAIAINYPLSDLLALFRAQAPIIFSRPTLGLFRRGGRYNVLTLHDVCMQIFQDRTLEDVSFPVLVSASGLDRLGHRVFTNLPGASTSDRKLKVADIVTASSAAPTYFQAFQPSGQDLWFVDGGLWANFPALHAVLEAHSRAKVPFEEMRLLCVGTGEFQRAFPPSAYQRKLPYSRHRIRATIDLMMAAQATYGLHAVQKLLGADRVISINPKLNELIELDRPTVAIERMIPFATLELHQNSAVLEKFLELDKADLQNAKLAQLRGLTR